MDLVRRTVMKWGQQHYKNFRWREIKDPWLALIAEIMLQRTNATHVSRYFEDVCQAFPDPTNVLAMNPGEIEEITDKFGMKRRAKTILALARYLDTLDMYPVDRESLESIYGIGHYTASAYLSLHMNQRAVLVDANIARWLARLTGQEKPVDVRRCAWLWELAEALTPSRGFKAYNYAVLDLTMNVCSPRTPDCEQCPCHDFCSYAQNSA